MKRIISLMLTIVMVITVTCGLSFESAAKDKGVITRENPAVVIRSSFATGGFKDGWGGVFTAVPTKDKEGYVLYDVVIWEDRINLYKFPNDIEHNDKEGFDFSCDVSTVSGLEQYVKWREGFCLKSVACKDTENINKSSKIMRDAFLEFFRIVNKRTPSENVVLKYSGHGYIGYSKCMNVEDTKIMLEKGVQIFGQKFALIDFGTNCRSGSTDYVNVYHNYTDYMLLSQLDYGGFSMDEWDFEKFDAANIDSCYSDMFVIGSTIEEAGKSIVDKSTERWKYCKKALRKDKIEQSMTLLDMKGYDAFIPEFAALMYKNNVGTTDVYSLISKKGNKRLKRLYNKFVIYYKSNDSKDYFVWEEKKHGLTAYTMVYKAELSNKEYTYNGKVQKPSVKVTLTNGIILREKDYYTVSYAKGRKNTGKYKVTISYKGNLGSKQELYFTIKPQKPVLTSATPVKKGFKAKWKALSGAVSGYQLQYSLKSSFAKAKAKLVQKAKKTNLTVKKLKAKKKYFVRVRGYKTVKGEKIYSPWSVTKTVKTK